MAAVMTAIAAFPTRIVAEAARRPLPKFGDSLLSFRFPSTTAARAIAAYRPDRVEWHYVSNPRFVAMLKEQYGIRFVGGTINADPEFAVDRGFANTPDGRAIAPPWMRGTNRRRITTADPTARAMLLAWVDRTLNAGCSGIQIDDGAFQWVSEEWGGDFSPHSLAGFGPWLAANVPSEILGRLGIQANRRFDYKAWLRDTARVTDAQSYIACRKTLATTPLWRRYLGETVLDFYTLLRRHLDRRSTAIPMSMNFGRIEPSEYFSALSPQLDYTVSEVQADDPPWRFAFAGATAESIGLRFAGCFSNKAERAQLRQAIANCHASGIIPVAPWDGYVPGAGGTFAARFTPPPQDYADLFAFARENARFLDGWTAGATVGILVPVDRYDAATVTGIVEQLTASNVPFRILMVGGNVAPRTLTRASLTGLSAVIRAHPRAAFNPCAQALLEAAGVVVTDVEGAKQYAIGDLGERKDWRLAMRQSRRAPFGSVVHLVACKPMTAPFSGTINLAVGTRFEFEKSPNTILLRPRMPPLLVNPRKVERGLAYDLPNIESWGLLAPA